MFAPAGRMDQSTIITILVGLSMAMGGFIGAGFVKRQERAESVDDRAAAKQTEQGETLAGAVARIAVVESAVVKVADALERIARIEEWQRNTGPRLDEADRTSRAIVAIDERVKTLFRLMEDMPNEVARQVVNDIMEKLRPRMMAAQK